ncbi:MFS transporter [Actinomyces haliotis]|uniref:MFS transporter n=1 Tax=Actinomyces haliotis TaxID=1280843 RepID=UPI002B26A9AF|nr:MFS transporter [Actinomyces haliotis]
MPALRLRLYTFTIAISLALFSSIDVLYLLSLGMTWLQVGTLTAVFNVAVLIAELPSSIVADVVSAKVALVSGLAIRCVGLFLFATANEFWAAAAAEALAGIGSALVSGSFDKVLIADLEARDEGTISGAYSMISRLSTGGGAIGVIVGVGLFQWQERACWIAAGCGVFVCTLLATSMRAPQPAGDVETTVRDVLANTVSTLKLPTLWVSIVAGSSGIAPYLLWQRLVSADGLGAVMVIGVMIAGAGWCGARLASTGVGRSVPLEAVILLNAFIVAILGWISPIAGMGSLFLVHVALQTLTGIRIYGMFQSSIPDSYRASATSLSSLGDSALAALGSYVTGAVMAAHGSRWAMLVSVVLYALLISMLLARRSFGGPVSSGVGEVG